MLDTPKLCAYVITIEYKTYGALKNRSESELRRHISQLPTDKLAMLNVSGVGEAKYEKYGERFIGAVTAFKDEHPEAIISIKDEDNAADAKAKSQKKRKNHKAPFYLNQEDGDKFEYHDLYFVSEIKDELNRIL